ncbi:hypothetical protein [Methanobacterium paludis]|uniref:hypothetical protein n=1 Tax=Methanobacterium paludis (strain DSM 25820 / JCM 18151 / SWAN1) TaxID=868131 RepID=UPI00064F50AA|nr:hypothetical protein [Methanobacterium paludis]
MIKMEEYVEFFKKLPIAVRTRNKVFISHAGPPRGIRSIDEIVHITDEGYTGNTDCQRYCGTDTGHPIQNRT